MAKLARSRPVPVPVRVQFLGTPFVPDPVRGHVLPTPVQDPSAQLPLTPLALLLDGKVMCKYIGIHLNMRLLATKDVHMTDKSWITKPRLVSGKSLVHLQRPTLLGLPMKMDPMRHMGNQLQQ